MSTPEKLQAENEQLKNELKVTMARLQAHIDTLNEALNTNMTLKINLNLTEQSRQEVIALNTQANLRITVLEKEVADLKSTYLDEASLNG